MTHKSEEKIFFQGHTSRKKQGRDLNSDTLVLQMISCHNGLLCLHILNDLKRSAISLLMSKLCTVYFPSLFRLRVIELLFLLYFLVLYFMSFNWNQGKLDILCFQFLNLSYHTSWYHLCSGSFQEVPKSHVYAFYHTIIIYWTPIISSVLGRVKFFILSGVCILVSKTRWLYKTKTELNGKNINIEA